MRLFLSVMVTLFFLLGCGSASPDGKEASPVSINSEMKKTASGVMETKKSEFTHESPITKRVYSTPDLAVIRAKLKPLQYKVTQEGDTEEPFNNEYWNNKRRGIYVDIVSGEPLFSSLDKFDSGTGWPSFTKPLESGNIVEKGQRTYAGTEVKSRYANSHLGHVFLDGPEPTGLRYCMNSASMRFIPKEDLIREGYGEYLRHFEKK